MDDSNEAEAPVEQQSDDLVIAEAVEVMLTMYSCRFCAKRFDTIDKVKTHFLKRHSNTLDKSGKKDDSNDEQSEGLQNDSNVEQMNAQ
ncbi:unnamed protein product, partial [Oppiella nova]